MKKQCFYFNSCYNKPAFVAHTASAMPLFALSFFIRFLRCLSTVAGELIASCPIVPKAKYYGCLMVEGRPAPAWLQISPDGKIIINTTNNPEPEPDRIAGVQFDFTEKRLKHFTNLKPGVTCCFYYYAVNAAGVSPLSAVVSIICL